MLQKFLVLAGVFLLSNLGHGFSQSLQTGEPPAPVSQFDVQSRLVSQTICRGDSDASILRLKVALQIRNISKKEVILSKFVGLSANEEVFELVDGKPESKPRLTYIPEVDFAPRSVQIIDNKLNSDFTRLKSNESYSVERDYQLIVTSNTRSVARGVLPPGNYILILNLQTWPYSETPAEEVRKKWSG